MLPDLSPTHILIVIVVALIVVGPKDLPQMLRKVGQFMGKMRGMANEFRASFDEMARQSELDELRKEVAAMRDATTSALPKDLGVQSSLDSENAYLANWAASHATPTDTPPEAFLPGPPDIAAPSMTAPSMTAIEAPSAGEIAAEAKASRKPRASKPKAKAAPDAEDAPAKPRRSRKTAAGDEA